MTIKVDMVNRALQTFGSRTTVTTTELLANSSNEAIQANLIYDAFRRRLLRLAPWSCGFQTAALTFITSVPGTPENTSPATQLWAKGQPAPPWAYEYQYPGDCLRACWVTPQTAVGFAGGVPITTAVTGGAPSFWQGPPVRFKVAIDQFLTVIAPVTIANGGTGYSIGDILTLPAQALSSGAPGGAGVQLVVTAAPAGVISNVSVVSQILGNTTAGGGSYFAGGIPNNPAASTGGTGTGATFNGSTSSVASDQRVILTNQEFALLNYVKDVTDENVFDPDFQESFAFILGGALCKALTGDKGAANLVLAQGNEIIRVARGNDGNEGLTVNDVTPDWLRIRGIDFVDQYSSPYDSSFNWGGMWPGYA